MKARHHSATLYCVQCIFSFTFIHSTHFKYQVQGLLHIQQKVFLWLRQRGVCNVQLAIVNTDFWSRRLSCATRGGRRKRRWPLFSPTFPPFFFLFLLFFSAFCFSPTSGKLPCVKICFSQYFGITICYLYLLVQMVPFICSYVDEISFGIHLHTHVK